MSLSQLPNRREAIQILAVGAAISSIPARRVHAAAPANQLGIGFSLYGMRKLPLARAATACADIGYNCIELPVMTDWPADSMTWPVGEQAEFAKVLREQNLRLSALMENLPIFGDGKKHQQNLDRLKAAAAIAHRVTTTSQPIVETILGGRPNQWPSVQSEMKTRLEDWAKVAEQEKIIIAIKAHVGGAMHLPEHPATLVKALQHPSIRAAYDFSHFQLRDVEMESSVATLAPHSVFAHVKDAAGDASNVRFLLPGQGDISYPSLLASLVKHGYRGDIVVEVSGQIHGKPGYDAIAAAKASYPPIANALSKIPMPPR